jgi:hypothetical protein
MRTLRLLPPVSLAHCVRRAIPASRLVRSLPPVRDALPESLGLLGSATPVPMKATQETADLPGSWGTLVTVRLGLGPRWDRHARPYGMPARSPLLPTTRTPDEQKHFEARCPGFPSNCLRFVVRVAPPHARLASGCWPALPGGIRTRRVPTEGFRVVVVTSHPPSPGFAWRNGKRIGRGAEPSASGAMGVNARRGEGVGRIFNPSSSRLGEETDWKSTPRPEENDGRRGWKASRPLVR